MADDEYRKELAKVQDIFFGWEDHGHLTCGAHMKLGSGGNITIGNYGLDEALWDTPTGERSEDASASSIGRRGTEYGMEFMVRFMQAFGVREWADIKSKTVYVLMESYTGPVVGIEPLPTENGRRFLFGEVRLTINAREEARKAAVRSEERRRANSHADV